MAAPENRGVTPQRSRGDEGMRKKGGNTGGV